MTECDTLMFSVERDCDMFSFECDMNALKRENFNSIVCGGIAQEAIFLA